MLVVSNLAKFFGEQLLFEGVSVQFNVGERYGVVGANGSGKSTLLRILAGQEPPSEGSVSMPKRARLGVLEQDHFRYEQNRIIDVVMMGNEELWAAMVEKEHLLERADQEFDAVFSNAALHWMTEPDRVVDGVRRALRPGGRFVGEMGGAGNVARIRAALVAALDRRGLDGAAAVPWYFPSPEDYRASLEAHGFTVTDMMLIDRPTPLPGEMADWLSTFAEAFILRLPAAERAAYVEEVVAALRPHLCDAEGRWTADYVRLRFRAVRPSG